MIDSSVDETPPSNSVPTTETTVDKVNDENSSFNANQRKNNENPLVTSIIRKPTIGASLNDEQLGQDILNRQDDIAAHFFEMTSFLQFFMSILSRYKFYLDPRTNQLQEIDRFVKSLVCAVCCDESDV